MKHVRRMSITIFLLVTAAFGFAFTNQPNESPGESMARMAKLGEQFSTPNQMHEFLTQMTGEWTTSTVIMNLPPESGNAQYSMIFGNRFLDGLHTGNVMGVDFIGRLTIGYDKYKHKFIASFLDNLGTSIRTAEGMLDRSGTTLSLWGTMDEWMSNEHDKPVMYRYNMIDKNHFVFEVHDLAMGDSSKVIVVTYTRAPKGESSF